MDISSSTITKWNVELDMQSTKKQAIDAIKRGHDKPVSMVNLLKFRERAKYDAPLPNGLPTNVSGREAYERYMDGVRILIEKLGGRIVYAGDVTGLLIGSGADFDMVAIAEYPSMAALMEMNQSKEFKAISHHRKAGLIGQLLIETRMSSKL